MFGHQHYVPILKWRQGEYQALFRLTPSVKSWITPLFEIPTEGWDFENEEPLKTLDEHLGKFGDRLKAKWGDPVCFVDSCYLDGDAVVASGVHHLEHIFNLARAAGTSPIPVTGLGRHPDYNAAVQAIVKVDARGACLRLSADDFDANLGANIDAIVAQIGVAIRECDLVIDLAETVSQSDGATALVWLALMQQLPYINDWRTLTIAGTAFPASLSSSKYRPSGTAPRFEWTGYKALLPKLPKGSRVPTFGDYAASHPRTELLDPRMLDPNAKIKYTTDDQWFIVLGTQVKRNGRGQYQGLCQTIVNTRPNIFMGAGYSWGDGYIDGCAKGTQSTGGTSTWPSVATNHHLTKVVRDVATLFGASALP